MMFLRKSAFGIFILFSVELALAQPETIAPQKTGGFPIEQFRRNLEGVPHPVHASATAKSEDASLFFDPEDGSISANAYSNKYFGLTLLIPPGWRQAYQQPPPATTGYYVLGAFELRSGDAIRGTMLITAIDGFFSSKPVDSAAMMVDDLKKGLDPSQHVERPLSQMRIGGKDFVRFDYAGAELHWVILATKVRCHILSFIFTSLDTQLLADLVQSMSTMGIALRRGDGSRWSTANGNQDNVPPCVKDYATEANVLRKVLPKNTSPSFSDVPVRLIIGADGRPKHIHVIAAFPEQAASVLTAVSQWMFKPRNEVETGLLFRFAPHQ